MTRRPKRRTGPRRPVRRALWAGLAVIGAWAAWTRLSHPDGSDVVLITIDTLRADRVSCYGGEGATPSMDGLAAGGAMFEGASNVPRTTPALATIMTGKYPQNHGVRFLRQRLPGEEQTLAERLTAFGYHTGAFVAGGPLEAATGLDRGFGLYRCYVDLKAGLLTLRSLPWLARNLPRRTFLWVHYFDPHFGYQPPWPYDRAGASRRPARFSLFEDLREKRVTFGGLHFKPLLTTEEHAYLRDQYLGEVEYTDAAIGLLLRILRMRDLITGRRSLVILTADHGESLGEHGCWYEHGEFLYEPDLKIPFVVSWPGEISPALRPHPRAELIDLAPTVLDLLGLPPLPEMDGRSLAPSLRGEAMPGRPLFVESGESFFPENPRRHLAGVEGKWRCVRVGGQKLILVPRPGGEQLELYDLRSDPSEQADLSSSREGEVLTLGALLHEWMSSSHRPGQQRPELDEQAREALRSLGYVD